MRGICLKKEKFVFPKVHKENSLFKKHMKGINGSFWGSQNPRSFKREILLAPYEEGCPKAL